MIIEINGVSTLNKSFSEVANLLVGKPGAELNIKVKRLNEILQFTIPIGWKEEAYLYDGIGNFYYKKGYFKESINYMQNAVEICKKHEYNQGLEVTLSNLGTLYIKLKDYPKAEKYLLDSLNIAKNLDDKHVEAHIYSHFGEFYGNKGDKKTAESYFTKSYNLYKSIGDNDDAQMIYDKHLKK